MQKNFIGLSAASGCLNQPFFQRPTLFVIRVVREDFIALTASVIHLMSDSKFLTHAKQP
jgi:hypothetical protein